MIYKILIILLLIPLFLGCQVLTTASSVISGSVACSSSESEQNFPKKGSIETVNVSFELEDEGKNIIINESVVCEYQGSMCGGGEWFQVWYGNRNLPSVEIPLSTGGKFVFNHHSQCIKLDSWIKNCTNRLCKPEDVVSVLVIYSKDKTKERGLRLYRGELTEKENQSSFYPQREVISISNLAKNGFKVSNIKVNINQ